MLKAICCGSHVNVYNVLPCLPVTILIWCSLVFGASIRQDRDFSEYDPSLSNSSKNLSCSHQLCKALTNCKNLKDPCPYIADYFSEDTSSSGYLVEDVLNLASFSKSASQSSVQASVIIGCGRKQTGSYLDGAAPDGLMGLGLGDISVPSLLAKAGLIQNSFAFCLMRMIQGGFSLETKGLQLNILLHSCLLEKNKTPILLGGVLLCWKFLSPAIGFQALVDSGASFTYLPTKIYHQVVLKCDQLVNAKRISLEGNSWKYCYNASF